MLTTACPDENALLRFAQGSSDDAEVAQLEAHLDTCGDCRRAVALAASTTFSPPAPRAAHWPELGARLGHYLVEDLLGRGGMGAVFAARDETLDRRVALKLLHRAGDDVARARLEREAQAMARLNHPNVVTVYALGDWDGGRFIAMELVDGLTFDVWRRAAPRTPREVLSMLLAAGRGLAAAHAAGVVHRDFKPTNVLVGTDGRARVSDFGLSRPVVASDEVASDSSLLTQAGTLLGTLSYMAPEQLDGSPADARSDQFSFCVTLVEALRGERPFGSGDRAALRAAMAKPPRLDGVPAGLRGALARGLSEEPSARFPTLEALLHELERGTTRRRVMTASAVGMVALLVGGAAVWSARTVAPSTVESPAVVTSTVEVERGALRLFELSGLLSAEVDDASIAEVEVPHGEELLVRGLHQGETVLRTALADGRTVEWKVRVVAH